MMMQMFRTQQRDNRFLVYNLVFCMTYILTRNPNGFPNSLSTPDYFVKTTLSKVYETYNKEHIQRLKDVVKHHVEKQLAW